MVELSPRLLTRVFERVLGLPLDGPLGLEIRLHLGLLFRGKCAAWTGSPVGVPP